MGSRPQDLRKIRVATLNLWAKQEPWVERRRMLIDGFRQLQPDLVALQEPIVGGGYDQVVDLLGSDYYVAHTTRGLVPNHGHQGASIASRWPLDVVHEVDLNLTPRTADFPCTTLIAEVAALAPVGALLFVNHLPSYELNFEYERELQAVAAARAVEDLVGLRTRHVIVAGDFDAVPDAASVRFWTGRQSLDGLSVCYRDAWEHAHPGEPGHTYTSRNPQMTAQDWPFQRIDYIMVRCGHDGPTLDIAACDLIFDEPSGGVWASDHFGLVADLAVPAQ